MMVAEAQPASRPRFRLVALTGALLQAHKRHLYTEDYCALQHLYAEDYCLPKQAVPMRFARATGAATRRRERCGASMIAHHASLRTKYREQLRAFRPSHLFQDTVWPRFWATQPLRLTSPKQGSLTRAQRERH